MSPSVEYFIACMLKLLELNELKIIMITSYSFPFSKYSVKFGPYNNMLIMNIKELFTHV